MIDSMTWLEPVHAGLFDEMEDEDNARGPEPDDDAFLRAVVPVPTHGTATPLAPTGAGQLQCANCSGWFGVTFWVCAACQSLGYRLPHLRAATLTAGVTNRGGGER
ncbi:hypothetical protein [Streptomyces sp. NBC_00687]|uniref:hypothetical protein n=1 Tax=Streptomyces sp. NBC_00687 TaxID=2975807 RepID=UPI0022558BC8|nr:hypothetical protein [Streptomyces sp. NBC_00687]MCX4919948.1 hypothetical protein [Streptomyces sp. NBC_00687]